LSAAGDPIAQRLVLRLVGGGSRRAELEQRAQRLGLGDSVTFVGQVPHSAVPAEIGKLDVFVALSRQESFGVAVLEAGAAGRPVVVSDADGLVEVVQHGQTGLVVPREDVVGAAEALRELIENPEQRQALGSAGREQVSTGYGWDQSVSKMLEVYDSALTARRAAQ
ncbi:MAG: glycosyltransferase, partial [Pseudomonadota bacterium]